VSLTIIEGPDGAGKSTLIEAWKSWLEGPRNGLGGKVVITHHTAYLDREDITPLYMLDLRHAHENPRNHYILDRSWISEFVYGPTMRGKIRVDTAQRRALERMALTSGAILIYCMPPFDKCVEAYQKRKGLEYLPDTDKLAQVYAGYQDLIQHDRYDAFPAITWDYAEGNNSMLTNEFIRAMEGMRPMSAWGPGIGSLIKGNTLIVGDEVIDADYKYPFTSYIGATKALSLLLDMAKISERYLYYIRARRPDGETTAGGTWLARLRPRNCIAITDEGERWAVMHGLKHVVRRVDPQDVLKSEDDAVNLAVQLFKGGI
jgi:thymidylate kinase